MATNLAETTDYARREALRLLKDIQRELEDGIEFKSPSMNYMSAIRFEVAEKLQTIAGKIAVANREESKWVDSPLNPANKAA